METGIKNGILELKKFELETNIETNVDKKTNFGSKKVKFIFILLLF